MMRKFGGKIVAAGIAVSLTALLGGCAATEQVADVKPVAGFLPEPSLLGPGKSGETALVYLSPDARWGSYSKMILEPVTIWTGGDSRWDAVPAEQKEALANTLYTRLREAASQHCEIVTEPSPGAFRLRVALVDADPANATMNTISTYVPQAHLISSLASSVFNDGVGFFAGTATVEGFATDAQNGELLWQGVDKRGGQNAIGSNTFDSWVDVDNAAKAWSEQLTARIAELGVCPG